jgi:thiol-disulfide isomerase/thioredoxin
MNNYYDKITDGGKLKDLIKKKTSLAVMFSSPSCGPCRAMKPRFQELAKKNGNTAFVYVDIDKMSVNGVESIPTFAFYRDNSLKTKFTGANGTKLLSGLKEITGT